MRELLRDAIRAAVRTFYPAAIYYWVIWAHVYRYFNDSKYKDIVLNKGFSPTRAQNLMDQLPWSPDTWKELWDVAASPKRFQRDLNIRLRTGIISLSARDCDDFACWACNVVAEEYNPRMLLVCYRDYASMLPRGHVVCYVEVAGQGFHIGNWGMRGPTICSQAEVAHAVAGQKAAELIAFAVLDKDLRVKNIKRV
jgi:hypothetical protein